MKKEWIRFISHAVILFGCVGITVNLLPLHVQACAGVSETLLRFAAPENTWELLQSKFSAYIPATTAQTTNTLVKESREAMKAIGSKDSDDGRIMTQTPADIQKLMQEAEKTFDKKKVKGKTSEEPYFGGGTLLSYGNIEVQSKIPDSFYHLDIPSLLEQGVNLKIPDKSKPTVLVYHSHTTEAYALLDKGCYINSDARSKNPKRNVVRVGEALVQALEAQGYSVIHDTQIHDEDYSASYDKSRVSVEKILEQYPGIEVTIDLHRDDITYSDKTKVKPTAVINGKKAARMMLIAGCEYGKVKQFPDWEYNLRFDLAVQQQVNAQYAGLMRPILFSQRKYNMFETHYSFLLEVGTDANTLEEACYAAQLFGTALGGLLEQYVA